MNRLTLAFAISLLLSSLAVAQESSPPPQESGTPIETLIEQVAASMDREFVIDPRIRGIQGVTTIGDIDYESLLGILRINGIVAIETGDQIHVMPEQSMRVAATRILQEDDPDVSDHEVVTRIIAIPELSQASRQPTQVAGPEPNAFFGTAPATTASMLVPVLRPMMSQAAHLSAVPGTNILIMVDRYDNIRRITTVVDEIIEANDD